MHYQDDPESVGQTLSAKLYEEEQRYMAPGLQEVSQLSRLVIKKARGCRLFDMEGKSYLDFMAGSRFAASAMRTPIMSQPLENSWAKLRSGVLRRKIGWRCCA